MKFLKIPVLICVTLSFILIACVGGGEEDQKPVTPESVAEKFLTALQFGDFDQAKLYASAETEKSLEFLESSTKFGNNDFAKDFDILKSEVDGDYAKVYYQQDLEKGAKVLRMRRSDARGWVVMMTKGDLTNSDIDISFDDDDNSANALTDMGSRPADLEGPSAVAWEFLTALQYGDFERAKRLGTKETGSALDMQSGLLADKENPYAKDFEIVDAEITGKYARVYYEQEGEADPKTLKLRNSGGDNWLVIMTKADWQENDSNNSDEDLGDIFKDLEKELNEAAEELEEELGTGRR